MRQGIEWIEQQGILKQDMPEQVVIATNMYYSAKELTAKYGDQVKLKYIKWEKRCDNTWDYALYPTRSSTAPRCKRVKWQQANAVHVVKAGGAPILAVLKDTGKNCSLGMAAAKVGDWPTAIEKLKAEVANVPDNDAARGRRWGRSTSMLTASNWVRPQPKRRWRSVPTIPRPTT